MASAVTKQRLHDIVDHLPESAWPAAERLLLGLADPFLSALANAPEDDEPETPEEAADVQEAYAEIERGDTISHADARRLLLGES